VIFAYEFSDLLETVNLLKSVKLASRTSVKAPTLDSQLCFALYSASSHVTGIYRPLLESVNLTYPQFLVMMALWEEQDVTISTLSERTTLGKSTLTPLLKLLEKKDLISRNAIDSDERQKRIRLTTAGRKLARKAAKIADEAFAATGLSKTEAKEIIRLCHRMVRPAA